MLYHSAVQELRQECHERSRSRKWEGVDVDALLTTSSDAPNHDLAHDDAQSQSIQPVFHHQKRQRITLTIRGGFRQKRSRQQTGDSASRGAIVAAGVGNPGSIARWRLERNKGPGLQPLVRTPDSEQARRCYHKRKQQLQIKAQALVWTGWKPTRGNVATDWKHAGCLNRGMPSSEEAVWHSRNDVMDLSWLPFPQGTEAGLEGLGSSMFCEWPHVQR